MVIASIQVYIAEPLKSDHNIYCKFLSKSSIKVHA